MPPCFNPFFFLSGPTIWLIYSILLYPFYLAHMHHCSGHSFGGDPCSNLATVVWTGALDMISAISVSEDSICDLIYTRSFLVLNLSITASLTRHDVEKISIISLCGSLILLLLLTRGFSHQLLMVKRTFGECKVSIDPALWYEYI